MSKGAAASFERGSSGDQVTLCGVVESAVAMPGSRSEYLAPVLVNPDGRRYRLLLVGDNPMEQPTFHALQGQTVAITGTWRNGVVRVEAADLDVREAQ